MQLLENSAIKVCCNHWVTLKRTHFVSFHQLSLFLKIFPLSDTYLQVKIEATPRCGLMF